MIQIKIQDTLIIMKYYSSLGVNDVVLSRTMVQCTKERTQFLNLNTHKKVNYTHHNKVLSQQFEFFW
jgi:hypothetical protein